MANYVIGDIQGCCKGLKAILKKAKFNPEQDKLYAVGDLVARGSQSLETLQFCRDLGDAFETVLGNHDLHLIAIAHGIRKDKPSDKLASLINHASFSSLIDWLMTKPLALKPEPKTLITHAGLYPSFSVKQALKLSEEIQDSLQSEKSSDFLRRMYGNSPDLWDPKHKKEERQRFAVNALTRMRYLTAKNRLEFETKCHPNYAPKNLTPWFLLPNKNLTKKHRIIFGHWASLNGLNKQQPDTQAKIFGLDTGYVWGNQLSLLNLSTNSIIRYKA
ncbi:symmetrical bis(5'-nucleosyl)-tetraphosphatase [Glaciecola sp. 1036]|uniref:symmetrical bis(5'-nucleosyl)-tetraphosphatase n=1 Tax=Alteromonadaceae TaxID=72275 RepID=UPI003D055DF2